MNGSTDQQELRQWMEDWQANDRPATPEDSIRGFVERRTRTLRLGAIADAVIGSGFLAFLLHRTITHPDPVEKIAMGLLTLVTIGALAFGLWNRRGLRRASMHTTHAFVALSLERAARLRRGIRAGWVVLIAEVVVFVPWVWYRLYGQSALPTPEAERFGWSFLAAMTALAIAGLLAMTAWASRDERRLAELREEMTDAIPLDAGRS